MSKEKINKVLIYNNGTRSISNINQVDAFLKIIKSQNNLFTYHELQELINRFKDIYCCIESKESCEHIIQKWSVKLDDLGNPFIKSLD